MFAPGSQPVSNGMLISIIYTSDNSTDITQKQQQQSHVIGAHV